jgi:hypothetical protein
MTISLTIMGDDAPRVLHELETLLAGLKPANAGAAAAIPAPQTAAPAVSSPQAAQATQEPVEQPKPRGRKKAPAADAVIEQTPIEAACAEKGEAQPEPGEYKPMTLDEVREFIRGCNTDGHLECVQKAMEHFDLKKTSDMDPDAGGKPSAKFGEYVAKIQQFIDEKAAKAEGGE